MAERPTRVAVEAKRAGASGKSNHACRLPVVGRRWVFVPRTRAARAHARTTRLRATPAISTYAATGRQLAGRGREQVCLAASAPLDEHRCGVVLQLSRLASDDGVPKPAQRLGSGLPGCRLALDKLAETRDREHPAVALTRLGQPIGVEQQQVAGSNDSSASSAAGPSSGMPSGAAGGADSVRVSRACRMTSGGG